VATLDFTDDLAIVIGDDFQHTFEFQDANCDPIDQTGNSFTATLLTKTGAVLETFTVVILDENVTISLSDAETAVLDPTKTARWKLRQTIGTVTTTVITGKAEVVEL